MIEQWLADFPQSPQRIAWQLRVVNNRLTWAQLRGTEKVDLTWLAQRNQRFETARAELRSFLKQHAEAKDWVQRARRLLLDSYQRQSRLAAGVSRVRAAGLLVQSVDALLELIDQSNSQQADVGQIPKQIWDLAHQVEALGQHDPAIYCLGQLPIHFPTHALAQQAVLRIAQLYAVNLANPIRAVEAYQEYLSVSGQEAPVRDAIFKLANELSANQRFLEAIHAYNVFVDSFPTHAQAAAALLAIGQTHQTNEAWTEAIVAYRRVLDEFPNDKLLPQVKFALTECQINLSQWREARRQYEDFLAKHPKDSRVAVAKARLAVLKNLERYQNLLGDDQVERNKDDAQFQIARIVQSQLQNPVKAVAEYRKVVQSFPKSDLADDAQIEIGGILLGLNRLVQAREELLKVTLNYPNSPVADDALYLIGQSYEQQAQSLVSVTQDRARKEVFARNQRFAYESFAQQKAVELQRQTQERAQLQKAGKSAQIDLAEASNAFRSSGLVAGNLWNTARGAELQAESETALQVASRQDRVNEAYRSAIDMYLRAASDYPLGDKTDQSLLRIAQIFENQLKDRVSAMETYQKIVKLFPGTPVAEDAAWKVAVFYEQESKFTAAAAAFREFIRNYPASARVADAQFSLAEVLEQLGKWVEAMDAYEVFRQKFGKHPKAQVAQAQINWIRTYRK